MTASSTAHRTSRKRPSFLTDENGAMIVEFAMIAPPLLFLLLAICQIGLVFLTSLWLDNATTVLGRRDQDRPRAGPVRQHRVRQDGHLRSGGRLHQLRRPSPCGRSSPAGRPRQSRPGLLTRRESSRPTTSTRREARGDHARPRVLSVSRADPDVLGRALGHAQRQSPDRVKRRLP